MNYTQEHSRRQWPEAPTTSDAARIFTVGSQPPFQFVFEKRSTYSMVPATQTMLRARECLANLLIFLATTEAFWYTINGDKSYGTSWCTRLGFVSQTNYEAFLITAGLASYVNKVYEIRGDEWNQFLERTEYGFHINNAGYSQSTCDLDALVKRENQDDRKRARYTLCVSVFER